MKFSWQDSEKEKFYQKAEKQLKNAGIDFVGVDRREFGVQGWNEQEETVQAVFVTLTTYSYRHFTSVQKGMLKKLGNWECLDTYRRGRPKPILMHSRLIFTELS